MACYSAGLCRISTQRKTSSPGPSTSLFRRRRFVATSPPGSATLPLAPPATGGRPHSQHHCRRRRRRRRRRRVARLRHPLPTQKLMIRSWFSYQAVISPYVFRLGDTMQHSGLVSLLCTTSRHSRRLEGKISMHQISEHVFPTVWLNRAVRLPVA